jgi:cytochrome c biogenesis protein CcmG/thiol:disulfide interchange protein DsbE
VQQTDPQTPAGPRPRWDRRRTLWAVLVGSALVALGVLLAVGLTNRDVSNAIDEAIAQGERAPAPEFALPVLVAGGGIGPVGATVTNEDLRGRPVVLNIWASWCDPCKDEAPLLQSIWDRYRAQGLLVLGLDVKDLEEDALAFHRTYGLTFPSLRDGEGEVQGRYGATGVPETFVLDRQGRVAAALRGPLVGDGAQENLSEFRQVLDTVLAEPAPGGDAR